MLDLQLNIEAMNVPDNLPHKTRAQEIEELAEYLSVSMIGTGGQSTVVKSYQEPSPDDADKPWLKLDVNGYPIGWYVNVNGTWIAMSSFTGGGQALAATPLTVTPVDNPIIVSIVATALNEYVLTLSGGIAPYEMLPAGAQVGAQYPTVGYYWYTPGTVAPDDVYIGYMKHLNIEYTSPNGKFTVKAGGVSREKIYIKGAVVGSDYILLTDSKSSSIIKVVVTVTA